MSIPLPAQVVAYIRAENDHDADAAADCFSPDAEVRDEEQVHRGRRAIRAWKAASSANYMATITPVVSTATPGGCSVACQVAGNFPGSPVALTFDFQLDAGLIAALEIKA